MLKAHEVMTQGLATCTPDASVSQVATIMRDRDIGDVLIVDEGKLSGIVTDRDLALHALTGNYDPQDTPVSKFMSTNVVTGEADWSVKRVAKNMAKHQIRRLPIVKQGQLVGIISLGDVALHEDRKDVVSKSLKAVSTPNGTNTAIHIGRNGALLGIGLAALATTMMTWLTWNRSGQAFRKQMAKSKFYHSAQQAAQQAVKNARDKVEDVASSETVRNLQHQVRSNLHDISAQLPTIEYKSRRRKHAWFR